MTVNQMISKLQEYEQKYGPQVLITIYAPDEFNDGKPVETPAIISELINEKGEVLSLLAVPYCPFPSLVKYNCV